MVLSLGYQTLKVFKNLQGLFWFSANIKTGDFVLVAW